MSSKKEWFRNDSPHAYDYNVEKNASYNDEEHPREKNENDYLIDIIKRSGNDITKKKESGGVLIRRINK